MRKSIRTHAVSESDYRNYILQIFLISILYRRRHGPSVNCQCKMTLFFHFVQITKRKWFVSCNSHIKFAFKLHVKFHAKQTVGGKTPPSLPVAMLPSLWSFWHNSRYSANVRPLVSFLTNCSSPGLPTPAPKLKELYQVLLRGQSNCRQ